MAAHCWHFCDGWHPDRIAVYDALYGPIDWEHMVEMMMTIREGMKRG